MRHAGSYLTASLFGFEPEIESTIERRLEKAGFIVDGGPPDVVLIPADRPPTPNASLNGAMRREVALVCVVGSTPPERHIRALEPDGYVFEPCGPTELGADLRIAIRRRKAELDRSTQAPRPDAANGPPAGVADKLSHELGDVLSNVLALSRSATEKADVPLLRRELEDISCGLRRSRALTRRLFPTAGTRRRGITDDVIDLRDIAESWHATAKSSAGPGIRLDLQTAAEPLWVRAPATGLSTVLHSLADNAFAALPTGGHITLTLYATRTSATLELTDDGCGMTETAVAQAFAPGFTTRPTRAAGLGLWSARKLVHSAHGTIVLHSALGVGTTVTVELPLVRTQTRTCEVQERRPSILFIEPQEGTSAVFVSRLRARGFAVVAARDWRRILERSEWTKFAAVVLDAASATPDSLRRLHAHDDMPPVVLTGMRPPSPIMTEARRLGVTTVLSHPYTFADLDEGIEDAIQQASVCRLHRALRRLAPRPPVCLHSSPKELLRRSIDQLTLVYQPIVRASDGSLHGREALVRSKGPLRTPGELFSTAEMLGEVPRLGHAIRCLVATDLSTVLPSGAVFVNVHPFELGHPLLSHAEALSVHADRVFLEITERAQLRPEASLKQGLTLLREQGFRIALDDLGEGYAGLNWLTKLRPEVVKLDMSLVRDVDNNPLKQDIVATMVGLCHRSGTEVVAEGVETQAEASVLREHGCDYLQGFFFGRPAPLSG